jgi:hypothetical protein
MVVVAKSVNDVTFEAVLPMLILGEKRSAMKERLVLSNVLAGFAVGLFVHAIPASWWPRWLRDLVGKKEWL